MDYYSPTLKGRKAELAWITCITTNQPTGIKSNHQNKPKQHAVRNHSAKYIHVSCIFREIHTRQCCCTVLIASVVIVTCHHAARSNILRSVRVRRIQKCFQQAPETNFNHVRITDRTRRTVPSWGRTSNGESPAVVYMYVPVDAVVRIGCVSRKLENKRSSRPSTENQSILKQYACNAFWTRWPFLEVQFRVFW